MDALSEFFSRLPAEVRRAGGSLPARAAVLVLALVANVGFYLPSIPAAAPGAGVPGVDKIVHVGVFTLTVWAAGRLLAPAQRFPMGWVVLAAIAHALLIEVIQAALLPERSADGADLLADLAGVALGLGIWGAERVWRERREAASFDEVEEFEDAR